MLAQTTIVLPEEDFRDLKALAVVRDRSISWLLRDASRLVVDTNVLVSSFLGTGAPRQVLNRVRGGQDLLCLSPAILAEYLAVL